MTDIAKILRTALAPIGYDVAQTRYDGTAERYFVFLLDYEGDDWGDDMPGAEVATVTLHFFSEYTFNTTALRESVCRALCGAGFNYPRCTDVTETSTRSDGQRRHIAFDTAIATEAVSG